METHSSALAWRIPGARSLVGCRLWGHTESYTTEATQQQQQYPLREDVSYVFFKGELQHKLEQIQTNFAFCPLLFIYQEWKNIAGLAVFSILSSVFIYQVPLYSEVKVKANFLDIPSSFPKPGCRHTFLNPDLLIQQYIMKILSSFLLIVMISNRRLLRVPWTARRSNQSILKISPGCSLEGLMLKLKLQYFGHLMRRVDSLKNTLMLGGTGGRRRRGRQRMRWLDGISDLMGMSLSKLWSW